MSNFHSGNGSEFINAKVADILSRSLIRQTKSRARRFNDNALVEGKNGSVVRKRLGYSHIPRRCALRVNAFYRDWFNVCLNFHRPCGYATTRIDRRGKEIKVYERYDTPFERLRAIPRAETYLRDDVTFELLARTAKAHSDNDFAIQMQQAKDELFRSVERHVRLSTTKALKISGSSAD